ncbi:MAG: 50S ribosomal protein L15 [Thermodesulfobacteriota bacterium]|nr:50S ribosomal protein L15 [Thermodesulfobacteriota bacterium]
MTTLHELKPSSGSKRKRKRVGRGEGSGHGKTACRGTKGQKARSGGGISPGFEGGQMPLQRRLPKRGFRNIFRKDYTIINLRDLARCGDISVIGLEEMKKAGLIKNRDALVKVLGMGEVQRALTVRAHRISEVARQKIESVGGTIEVIG